ARPLGEEVGERVTGLLGRSWADELHQLHGQGPDDGDLDVVEGDGRAAAGERFEGSWHGGDRYFRSCGRDGVMYGSSPGCPARSLPVVLEGRPQPVAVHGLDVALHLLTRTARDDRPALVMDVEHELGRL